VNKYGHICVGFFLIFPQLQFQLQFFSFFFTLIVEANVCNTVGLVRVDGDLLGSLGLVRVNL